MSNSDDLYNSMDSLLYYKPVEEADRSCLEAINYL